MSQTPPSHLMGETDSGYSHVGQPSALPRGEAGQEAQGSEDRGDSWERDWQCPLLVRKLGKD